MTIGIRRARVAGAREQLGFKRIYTLVVRRANGIHGGTLAPGFAEQGFEGVRVLGGMGDVPYHPLESPDCVLVARRR